jgi:hypothetical protein
MRINAKVQIAGSLASGNRVTVNSSGTLNNLSVLNSSIAYFTQNSPIVTGILAPEDMQVLYIYFTGVGVLSFTHEDLLSLPSNRIITPTDLTITINPGQALGLMYDNVATRWRVLFMPGASGGAPPPTSIYPITNLSDSIINHNLGYYPLTSVLDTTGTRIFVDENHVSVNSLNLRANPSLDVTVILK